MNSFAKKISAGLFAAVFVLTSSVSSMAAVVMPEKIRVGICFNDSKTGTNKAVSSFKVSADKGAEFGFYASDKFVTMAAEASSNDINVTKDSSYYIQIGDKYVDPSLANMQVLALQQKGIKAFKTYKDGWWVWTGPYQNEVSASTDILVNLKKKDDKGKYTAVEPSLDRIVGTTAAGSINFVFDSSVTCLQIRPLSENVPYILKLDGNKQYRGEIQVKRLKESDMTVINVLPIEEYLYGVVPAEIESDSDIEAIKAQAVAARTYTLNNIGKYSTIGFDVCNTVNSQVYNGYKGESAAANKAVDETKGKKILYQDKPAQVFYFSSSGGKTEDAKNVWGSDFPYLKSVEDKYESGTSRNYNWEISLTPQKIKEIMISKGKDLGDITGVDIIRRSEAGRVVELVVKGTKDQAVFKNSSTRSVFNLNSQWYDIVTGGTQVYVGTKDAQTAKTQLGGMQVVTAAGTKTLAPGSVTVVGSDNNKKVISAAGSNSNEYKFVGKGWGHAVGMSQEGAKGMAKAGFTYDKILMHYFTGTTIE